MDSVRISFEINSVLASGSVSVASVPVMLPPEASAVDITTGVFSMKETLRELTTLPVVLLYTRNVGLPQSPPTRTPSQARI